MNTVGPYENRQETYGYFTLPFCKGAQKEISHYHETMSDAIQGVDLVFSGYGIEFKSNLPSTVVCAVELDKQKVLSLAYAVQNNYWYQMYIDELPIWGRVGERGEDKKFYIFSHQNFEIGYNDDRIVDIKLTNENRKLLTLGDKIEFTYSVTFTPSTVKFEDRFDKYLDPTFFQHKIHWFSIFNSFMMVLFLVGLVSMILMRTLRKDYQRYSKDEEMDDLLVSLLCCRIFRLLTQMREYTQWI